MNWKNTWILVGLAAALFAFIALFERRLQPTGYMTPPAPLFSGFKPTGANTVQIRRGAQFAVTLEQTNGTWRYTKPFEYPAASFAVQSFLEALDRIVPATHITTREIIARKQTSADFGFDPPPVVVLLEKQGERPVAVRFGGRTPAGDQVYVEVDRQPGYFVVNADILDQKVPRTQHDWRDTALFHLGDEPIDSAEIVRGGAGFKLALDPTNKLWRLERPSLRADQLQVQQLLNKIQTARALEFVTDERPADLEPYGLQAPEFEVTLTAGGATQKVQLGRAPTNDPTRVYARLLAHTNIVLVPKSAVDVLATPYAELRDRQLVAFAPELVDIIEVGSAEPFVARKNAGGWLAGDAPANPVLMAQWLNTLSQLQVIGFVKDVVTVTGFAPYGLEPAQRQYSLRTVVTNAAGPTNILIARLGVGTNAASEGAFARRYDEDSAYAISAIDYSRLPSAAWQLRDHHVWSFTTNQVVRMSITQNDTVREVLRQPNGEWIGVKGFTNPNPFVLEELAFRIGDLNAVSWIARGADARTKFGFTTNSARLSIELRGEKPQTLSLEFGGLSPLRLPYALTTIDGQPTVFEFPWQLYIDLQIANLAPAEVNLRLPKPGP